MHTHMRAGERTRTMGGGRKRKGKKLKNKKGRGTCSRSRSFCGLLNCFIFSFLFFLFRNDTAIVATNPTLRLPGERITFVQLNFGNDGSLSSSRLCTKVDPGWAAGITNNPIFPQNVGITVAQSSAGLASYVLDHPWSIGLSSPYTVIQCPRANLINQANKVVAPTPATAAQAFLELAANGILPGGNGFDLSNAQSAFAWPTSVTPRTTTTQHKAQHNKSFCCA